MIGGREPKDKEEQNEKSKRNGDNTKVCETNERSYRNEMKCQRKWKVKLENESRKSVN